MLAAAKVILPSVMLFDGQIWGLKFCILVECVADFTGTAAARDDFLNFRVCFLVLQSR